MNIEVKRSNDTLEIQLEGRLDTQSASELETCIAENLAEEKRLVVDFTNLEYISSAGLRSLLSAHKMMAQREASSFTVVNPNDFVRDVFDTTGFTSILDIKDTDDSNQ